MKEVRIKLDESEYRRLITTAKKELRSISKQVTLYIIRGLEIDQKEPAHAGHDD